MASYTVVSIGPPAKWGIWSWKCQAPSAPCGNRGRFDALGEPRLPFFAKSRTRSKMARKTVLTELLGNDLDNLRSGDLRKAIKRGDKFVERVS